MKWSDTITFTGPLRDVQLRPPRTAFEVESLVQTASQAAYERGRQDGEKNLSEQLLQQRSDLIELQQGIFESLRRAVPDVIHQTENMLLQLALECAQKLVAGLPITSEMLEAVVREAVKQVEDGAEITIHLNADDLAMLRHNQASILKGLPESGPLRFTASAEVTRGGCLVQTRFGLLDARRETKIAQLRDSLSS